MWICEWSAMANWAFTPRAFQADQLHQPNLSQHCYLTCVAQLCLRGGCSSPAMYLARDAFSGGAFDGLISHCVNLISWYTKDHMPSSLE